MVISARAFQLNIIGADIGADFFFCPEVKRRTLDFQKCSRREAAAVAFREALREYL